MEVENRRVQPGWRSNANANTKSNDFTYSYANCDGHAYCDNTTIPDAYALDTRIAYPNSDNDAYTDARTSSSDAEASPDAASETVAVIRSGSYKS